jgi:hypothetical protein
MNASSQTRYAFSTGFGNAIVQTTIVNYTSALSGFGLAHLNQQTNISFPFISVYDNMALVGALPQIVWVIINTHRELLLVCRGSIPLESLYISSPGAPWCFEIHTVRMEQQTPLFQMPGELRNRIYHYALDMRSNRSLRQSEPDSFALSCVKQPGTLVYTTDDDDDLSTATSKPCIL